MMRILKKLYVSKNRNVNVTYSNIKTKNKKFIKLDLQKKININKNLILL